MSTRKSGATGRRYELLIQVRYRDEEYRKCPHVEQLKASADVIAVWESIRGETITIDTDTFKAGECQDCDTWLIVPRDIPNLCATRISIEIGD
jgi:hypothetical protein